MESPCPIIAYPDNADLAICLPPSIILFVDEPDEASRAMQVRLFILSEAVLIGRSYELLLRFQDDGV